MTNSRLLARNSILNLLGQGLPLAVAVFAVRLLVKGLGVERFGILQLAWAAIGYFSLFDLGLGRALTRSASAALGGGRAGELPEITGVALKGMAAFGLAGGIIIALATPLIVDRLLDVRGPLRPETVTSFYLLSASLPFVLITAGLRSLFESHQQFGVATALRVPYAIFNYVAPLAVLPVSHSLVPVIAILVFGRVVICVAHWLVARHLYPFLRTRVPARRDTVRTLLATGGWMTVSNVISPLMVNFDRFVVGGFFSLAAIAYYATPFDMVMKLLLIPGSLLGVLFPAFAETFERDPAATAVLFDRTMRVMLLAVFPPVLLLVTLASEGMRLWLGPEFAAQSAPIVRWLAAGLLINSIGQIAFSAIQGVGRSDLTAKLHLIELPIYALVLVILAKTVGLTGVAIAWTIRVALDTAVLLAMTARRLPQLRADIRRSVRVFSLLLATLLPAALIQATLPRLVYAALTLAAFAMIGWLHLLRHGERQAILGGGEAAAADS